MSEKLLTVEEAAQILGISADEVKMLSQKGLIPAYRIGGIYLRFKKEQIQRLREKFRLAGQISPDTPQEANRQMTPESQSQIFPSPKASPQRGEGKGEGPQVKYTAFERVKDFLFYNDFYIISIFIMAVILFFIFKTS